ncbi:TrmH family RNA methyltransferase [Autumnicola musiva]|uniref:tRNA (guanosine(18)-2'-O)-methyltransferase n=1 Tax=Autumnicola musiva TaxID=3075589 RepID=A0ABU3D946_9FLAO|nr:RNA methyltransferase [Zunongwangia sp. F117]MDT0678047.1 RNA methyltransferase [Zunongwangia sp. F117]
MFKIDFLHLHAMTNQNLLDYFLDFLTPRRRMLFEKVISERTNYFTVATQDVYQLHNTSAVLRSCDVFGIQNIHVIEERNPRRIDKEIAMGAQKWVDVNRYTSTATCVDKLKQNGYRIVATSPHGNAQLLQEFDISSPAAIFFGTEKNGLSEDFVNNADAVLKIPMYGFTESLNISVSAAIILQSLMLRLRESNYSWRLKDAEREELHLAWARKSVKNSDDLIKSFRKI